MKARVAAYRAADLAALAIVAVCVWVVASPLVAVGLPETDDSQDHLVRFAAFAMTVERGTWAPRWTGPLNLQYGSPIFSYYAPLAYYEAEAIHLLGATIPDSLRWLDVAGLALSALAAYLLGRELAGRPAGIALAACYVALPYQLLDVYVRGALAEALALWLPPLALFAWARHVRTGRRRWLAVFAASLAALVLTHNISALIFAPIVVLCALGIAWESRARMAPEKGAPTRLILHLALACAVGAGLAAWFWLPAIATRQLVHSERMTADFLDVHRYVHATWPPFQATLAAAYRHDAQKNPVVPGLVQVLLAAVGCIALAAAAARAPCRRSLLWLYPMTLVAAGLLALQRPETVVVWDHAPLARYVQFPYRLLGPFGLITSALACCIPLVARSWLAQWALAIFVGTAALASSTAALPPPTPAHLPPVFDARSLLQTEAAMGELAATSASEYTPATVVASTRGVIQSVTGSAPPPAAEARAPDSAVVVRDGDTDVELRVAAPQAATLVLRRFFAPDWTATLDGRTLATRPVGDLGLLGVDLPPGSGLLTLAYHPSRLETAAIWLSVATACALAAWCGCGARALPLRLAAPSLVLVAALAVAARVPDAGADVVTPASLDLAPGFALQAAKLDTAPVASQSLVRLWLYILTRRPGRDLTFRTKAVDHNGRLAADVRQRPWNGSTTWWLPGELAPAALDVPLPGGASLGAVTFDVTAYDASRPDEAIGSFAFPETVIGATPTRPYHTLGERFADTLGIVAYSLDASEDDGTVTVWPGQTLGVTLEVQSLRWMGEDESVFVHLLDPQGRLSAQHDELAGGRSHPTSTWVSGELVRQRFPIVVPPDAPAGHYRFEAGFYQLATMKRLALRDPLDRPAGDSLQFGDVFVR